MLIEPEPLQSVDRTCVRYRGRKLSSFSGCDYFRLASHPAVLRAVQDGLAEFGLNVSASRLTTGNHALYQTLERRLASFFACRSALLVSAGYQAPLTVAQALAGTFSHALLDGRAHPALLDAARFLDCPVLRFKHRDPEDCRRVLRHCGNGARPILLTDGMFSYDGSVAPLKAYLEVLPADGLILLDDAHGAGVLGRTGKGTVELEAVSRRRVVQCITLSKAFGASGGAVLGSRALRRAILSRSRMFVGSTPMPLPVANAALAAVGMLRDDRELRLRLSRNTAYVRTRLRDAGLDVPQNPGPIIPLPARDQRQARDLKRRLLAADIYPPFLRYPGGPQVGCFRFVISSEHSRLQLDNLLGVLTRLAP